MDTCKDLQGTRKRGRQRKKVGGQHPGVDGPDAINDSLSKSEYREGRRKLIDKSLRGAPTVRRLRDRKQVTSHIQYDVVKNLQKK